MNTNDEEEIHRRKHREQRSLCAVGAFYPQSAIHDPRSANFNLSAQRGRLQAGVYGKRALPMIECEEFGGTDFQGAGEMEHVHGPAAEQGRLRAEEAEGVRWTPKSGHAVAKLSYGDGVARNG
jgi:hypothetical protein